MVEKEVFVTYQEFFDKRQELLDAASTVERSMNYIRAEITKMAENQIGVVGHTILDTLSDMEQECSHYLYRGLSNYALLVKELCDINKFIHDGGTLETPFYKGREFRDYSEECTLNQFDS